MDFLSKILPLLTTFFSNPFMFSLLGIIGLAFIIAAVNIIKNH